MPSLSDFNSVMNDLRTYQQELADMDSKIKHPEEKEMMGKIMQEIEDARRDAERVVPDTLRQIEESARQSAAEAERQKVELEQRKQEMEKQMAAAEAAAAAAPASPTKSEARVAPKLGEDLREELLERFATDSERVRPASQIKEAWQYWQ